jgi:CRP-like cAMP-binding protein
MAYFIHAANILYLFSYLVRDILWLRVLTVVAGLTLMPYFLLQSPPLLAPVAWNVLFTGINAFQIARLLYERRPVVLTEDQARLYQLAFRALTDREFLRIARIGAWKKSDVAEQLVEQGSQLEELSCVLAGKLAVKVDGKVVARLEPGRFVGEMSYLTGARTTASVEAIEPTTCLCWTKASLTRLLDADPSLRAAVQLVIGRDLVTKLRAPAS